MSNNAQSSTTQATNNAQQNPEELEDGEIREEEELEEGEIRQEPGKGKAKKKTCQELRDESDQFLFELHDKQYAEMLETYEESKKDSQDGYLGDDDEMAEAMMDESEKEDEASEQSGEDGEIEG